MQLSLFAHGCNKLLGKNLAGIDIVHAVGCHALARGCVAIKRDDLHALVNGGVDRGGEDVCIGDADGDTVDADVYQVGDCLRLLLGIFGGRGAPVDFDLNAALFAEFFACVKCAGFGGLEDGVVLALGDNAKDELLFGACGWRSGGALRVGGFCVGGFCSVCWLGFGGFGFGGFGRWRGWGDDRLWRRGRGFVVARGKAHAQ